MSIVYGARFTSRLKSSKSYVFLLTPRRVVVGRSTVEYTAVLFWQNHIGQCTAHAHAALLAALITPRNYLPVLSSGARTTWQATCIEHCMYTLNTETRARTHTQTHTHTHKHTLQSTASLPLSDSYAPSECANCACIPYIIQWIAWGMEMP